MNFTYAIYFSEMADCYIKISCALKEFSITEHGTGSSMEKFLAKTADIFEKARVCFVYHKSNERK